MQQKGTVWIIGASSGLGLATANAFAQDGWLVVSGARSFLGSPPTEGPCRLHLDVTDETSCDGFVRDALKRSPRVDAIVCCAAQLVLGSCENISLGELNRLLDTNVLGTVRMIKRALPLMRKQQSGKIILFSSINGLLGIPFQSAYTMSKHALEGYAECLAMETERYGIQVCLVEPGDHRGGSQRTRLHAAAESSASPYYHAYENACSIISRDEAQGLSPDALGKKVVRNANKRRMRFRLKVAKPDQRLAVWLHTWLPARMNQRILNRYYHTCL
ncbi:MAG: SDR family oxidoreductase [Eubacteriales bacterium]|nr:SDR family oxidoreductase [Eubacteriales bacterium]